MGERVVADRTALAMPNLTFSAGMIRELLSNKKSSLPLRLQIRMQAINKLLCDAEVNKNPFQFHA